MPELYNATNFKLIAKGTLPALGIAIGLGCVYGILDFHVPFRLLAPLATVACGIGLGYASLLAARLARVYRPKHIAIFALSLLLVAYLVSWPVWLWCVRNGISDDLPGAALSGAFDYVRQTGVQMQIGPGRFIAAEGAGQILVWILEVLIMVMAAMTLVSFYQKPTPFCAACGLRCSRRRGLQFTDEKLDPLVQAMLAGNWDFLSTLRRARPAQAQRLGLEYCSCDCGNTHLISLKRTRRKRTRLVKDWMTVSVLDVQTIFTRKLLEQDEIPLPQAAVEPSESFAHDEGTDQEPAI